MLLESFIRDRLIRYGEYNIIITVAIKNNPSKYEAYQCKLENFDELKQVI